MRDMPNLDMVRSIAVLTVVIEHNLLALHVYNVGPFPIAYFGVLGVFVFFVHTSLVLMWSMERKPHTLDFYIRRVFRIYPLAWAIVAIALITRAPVQGFFAAATNYRLSDVVMQALLLQGVLASNSFVGVMWSLPYEVLMYVLLPMFFFYVQKNFSLWPIMVLWLVDIVSSIHTPSDRHNFGVAIGYFLPGIMAYVGFARFKPRLPGWMLPVFLSVLWCACWYHCNFHKGWVFCLLVGLGLPFFRQIQSRALIESSKQIAKYSYGIYLTHTFAMVIGLYLLKNASWPVRVIGELVPLVVFPILAYHLVEHPMIRLGSRLAARAEAAYEQKELAKFREVPAVI